jgi:CubicO group peptidase (beta-lactamase class C family)
MPRLVPARHGRRRSSAVLAGVLLVAVAGCGSPTQPSATTRQVEQILTQAMHTDHLRAVIATVTVGSRTVYTGAMGTSMTGVPATVDMHFRNGAFAYTYMGETLVKLVDKKRLSLDDHISKWFPQLPGASGITVRMLANSTAGYADYVYLDSTVRSTDLYPFAHQPAESLIPKAVAQPPTFRPGTNWGYSHTNFIVLGEIISKVTHTSLAQAIDTYALRPMGLRNTTPAGTPAMPEPVLHTYSSERRAALKIPHGLPFYEDSTYWDPAWTAPTGAVETTDIADLAKSIAIVGSGAQVSKAMYQEQVVNNLIGLGHPTAQCPACRQLSQAHGFGFMLLRYKNWVVQSKFFAGSAAIAAYLPSQKITIAVEVTYTPDAFDQDGNSTVNNDALLAKIATVLAPHDPAD